MNNKLTTKQSFKNNNQDDCKLNIVSDITQVSVWPKHVNIFVFYIYFWLWRPSLICALFGITQYSH